MKSEKTEPMTLTKATIIEKLQDELGSDGFTKSKSSEVIETLLTIMKDTMEKGEDILISGFGKFQVREKSQRKGTEPRDRRRHDALPEAGRHIQMFRQAAGQDQRGRIACFFRPPNYESSKRVGWCQPSLVVGPAPAGAGAADRS